MKHPRRLFCLFLVLCVTIGVLPVNAVQTKISVSGLTVPQVGELIDFTASSAQPDVYTVDEVCWYTRAQGAMYDTVCQPGESFSAGQYLCRVYLTFAAGVEPVAGTVGDIDGEQALLGLYRGRWFLECAYTAKPSTRISFLSLGGIDVPSAGARVGDYTAIVLTEAAGCTISDVTWSLGGTALADTVTFRAGEQVSCTVTVQADEGYRFHAQPAAGLCGKSSVAAIERVAGKEYRFVFLFTVSGTPDGAIEQIKIGAVSLKTEAPAAGASPSAITASNGVTVSHAVWSPDAAAFAEGVAYTLTVTLNAEEGYCFPAEPLVTVNGQQMQLVGGNAGSLSATYTFPKTEQPYVFPFTDVSVQAWYYSWVREAHRMGLIDGKSATLYEPDAAMTWAEAVKLAACIHQLYYNGQITLTNGEPWYQSYLDYCLANGIVDANSSAEMPGHADIAACADEAITRAAYVCLFVRAMPAEALPAINAIPNNAIPDVPVSDSMLDDGIYLFYRAGILNGTDAAGTFLPDSFIRRRDVAAILVRLMDRTTRVGPPSMLGK